LTLKVNGINAFKDSITIIIKSFATFERLMSLIEKGELKKSSLFFKYKEREKNNYRFLTLRAGEDI